MKILVKENVILEVRVFLEFLVVAKYWAVSVFVLSKQANAPIRKLLGDQINGQEVKGHLDEGLYHLPQGLETGIYILHLQLVDGTTVYYKVFLLRE